MAASFIEVSQPDFDSEDLLYINMLRRALGSNNVRKCSLFAKLTQPHRAKDFAKLIDEWQLSHDKK